MEKLRIQDRIGMCADTGQTCMKLNLYKKQVNALIDDGFSVQRLGAVPNYPEQGSYKIDWSEAPEGSVARHYLERSRKENDFFPFLGRASHLFLLRILSVVIGLTINPYFKNSLWKFHKEFF